jgi:hypothetical protein
MGMLLKIKSIHLSGHIPSLETITIKSSWTKDCKTRLDTSLKLQAFDWSVLSRGFI